MCIYIANYVSCVFIIDQSASHQYKLKLQYQVGEETAHNGGKWETLLKSFL